MNKFKFLVAVFGCCLAFTACSDDADTLLKDVKVKALSDPSGDAATRTAPSDFKTNWQNAKTSYFA